MSAYKKPALFALGAVACFHLANAGPGWGALMIGFLYFLLRLTEAEKFSEVYWPGLAAGFFIYAPSLAFMWGIFGILAVSLWLILCAWLLFFLILAWWWRRRYGRLSMALVAPILWTGIEYFRGELYYLRFSWLIPGYAFSGSTQMAWLGEVGVYGIGFAGMVLAAILYMLPLKLRVVVAAGLLLAWLIPLPSMQLSASPNAKMLRLAGVQLEFQTAHDTYLALAKLVQEHPAAEVLVLSEYAFEGQVPQEIKAFCRDNKKYLIAGGRAPARGGDFYDTAFVVGPDGNIIFSQAKCVPVQFFDDGLPALQQRVWYSPWGKIGLGICYDASYRRVVDELVDQGAQALIFPTMDVVGWGAQEHRLNALVAPVRAAEYQLPLFRVASSGISEAVNPDGTIQARADFPGPGQSITAEFRLPGQGRLPLDHWLAPACTALTAGLLWWLIFTSVTKRFRRKAAVPPLQE